MKFLPETKIQVANTNACKDNSLPFIMANGIFCVLLLLAWIDLALNNFIHPLYNGASAWYVFLASLVVLIMAAQHSLVLQILSVLLTGFYTQRVVITYYAPESLDYNNYVNFTNQNIQNASQFYLLCVIFILAGAVILKPFLTRLCNNRRHLQCTDRHYIHYFAFRANFTRLCRIALWIILIAYCFKFWQFAKGFGLTGSVYESDETILMWSIGIADYLSPFVLFSWIYFPKSSRCRRLATAALILFVVNGLAMASKGFFLGLMVSYFMIMRLTGRKLPKKFFIIAAFTFFLSIFIIFPAMTVLRTAYISGTLTFDAAYYSKLLAEAFMSFSRRLGGFDWMTLWLTVPKENIPPNANAVGELIGLLNKFIPGEIVAQPDTLHLSKLQNLLGRGWGDLHELGGHGENQGGLATAYIFWGKIPALFYLSFWGAAMVALEKARIHLFHKVTLLSSYLIVFVIGGGFILMHGTFFWYIIFTTFLVLVQSLLKNKVRNAAVAVRKDFVEGKLVEGLHS